MKASPEHHARIAKLKFAAVYPLYLEKLTRKGRSQEELHEVIEWLTGFSQEKIQRLIREEASFEVFFKQARLHPKASQIKGLICGYRIEEIDDPLTRQVRYLDKLVDELAQGKSMDKVLRQS